MLNMSGERRGLLHCVVLKTGSLEVLQGEAFVF